MLACSAIREPSRSGPILFLCVFLFPFLLCTYILCSSTGFSGNDPPLRVTLTQNIAPPWSFLENHRDGKMHEGVTVVRTDPPLLTIHGVDGDADCAGAKPSEQRRSGTGAEDGGLIEKQQKRHVTLL